jgi:hypothetical protein
MSPSIRFKHKETFGVMTVYRRPAVFGEKPFVVGTERNGRLVLLEEFTDRKEANKWAQANANG